MTRFSGDDPPKPAEGRNANENQQQQQAQQQQQQPAGGAAAWPAGEMGLGGGGLGVIHQALVQQESPVGKPNLFKLFETSSLLLRTAAKIVRLQGCHRSRKSVKEKSRSGKSEKMAAKSVKFSILA